MRAESSGAPQIRIPRARDVPRHGSGASWTTPNGIAGLQHAHGNASLYQTGDTLFVAGTGGPGDGVYRSTDLGQN